ncbi:MAG: Lrp/AsnC family transcriptional regulator [Clostridia bacterium]|nr:Lrp/AsnC family transcriptional regulator [Clostridia bacterium]
MDQINQKLIKILQGNLPFEENPYESIGRIIGISEEEVIERLKALKDAKKLKKIRAVLRHQKSGYKNNAMVVFKTDAPITEKVGLELASSPLVSHCYERQLYEDWPYNLYAMVHSRKEQEIEVFVQDIVTKYKIEAYEILYSVQELKKTSMVYFE